MNHFNIALLAIGPIIPCLEGKAYDPELDCVTSLLCDACELLDETRQAQFVVSGFGQDPWPVDVHTDLPVVVEQIPTVLEALSRGEPAVLGFYEQGIGRILSIAPQGVDVTIECSSTTNWRPTPESIRMPTHELVTLLEQFLDGFVDLVRQRCPDLVDHAWFRSWYVKRD
jgi:hypothetical protein